MANVLDSNITDKVARVFLEKFDSGRTISKNVNTQLLDGKFDPSSGDRVRFKRPHDYRSVRTPDGDLSATTSSDIITGTAEGLVQDYISVELDFASRSESLFLDQLDEIVAPAATRVKTDLETDFAAFVRNNTGLLSGTVGTAVTSWDDVAGAGAIMQSTGVPMDDYWCCVVNPFTQRSLASDQRSLGGETGMMDANKMATITENFAGMKVMTATTLASYQTGTGADRSGTLAAAPDATYDTARNTMTQAIAVTGFEPNLVIAAGEVVSIPSVFRLNLSTRLPIIGADGEQIPFTATVAQSVTLDGAGSGTIIITGPAINEADGQYNTVTEAPQSGAQVLLGGAADTIIQPNLFWHKQAFSIGSVPQNKLYSTDTIATTEDGLQFRVSKGTSFRENQNIIRIDFLPAYAALNPFFAGQLFGTPTP